MNRDVICKVGFLLGAAFLTGCNQNLLEQVYYFPQSALTPHQGPYLTQGPDLKWYKFDIQSVDTKKCKIMFSEATVTQITPQTGTQNISCLMTHRIEGKARTLSSDELAEALGPVSTAHYAYADPETAYDEDRVINIGHENEPVSRYLKNTSPTQIGFLIVPGYTPRQRKKPKRLHAVARERLELAVARYRADPEHTVILVTGGNVYPTATIYNEAYEMKRALLQDYAIPEDRVAIEPYARNSVTNLRNAGRFMLAHGIERATILTTGGQSFYFSNPEISTFHIRSLMLTGHTVGDLSGIKANETLFKPGDQVFIRRDGKIDP